MNQVLEEQQPLSAGDSSQVATAVMPSHSRPGTVLGAADYISSEQAKVKPGKPTSAFEIRSEVRDSLLDMTV
jgi:hypothetical protein